MTNVTLRLVLLISVALYQLTHKLHVSAEVLLAQYSQVFMGSIEFVHLKGEEITDFQNAMATFALKVPGNNSTTIAVTTTCHLQNQGPIRKRQAKMKLMALTRVKRRRRKPVKKPQNGQNPNKRSLLSLRDKLKSYFYRNLQDEDAKTRENTSSEQQQSCSQDEATSISIQYSIQWKHDNIRHLEWLKREYETFMRTSDGRKATANAIKNNGVCVLRAMFVQDRVTLQLANVQAPTIPPTPSPTGEYHYSVVVVVVYFM